MKILHLIHDNKFLDFVNEIFSVLPGVENRFIAFAPGDDPTKHLAGLPLWRRIGWPYFFSRSAREDLDWCNCLIVHYLESYGALLMLRSPARVTTVWSAWGADYLAFLPGAERAMFSPETAALVESIRRKQSPRGLREATRRSAARILRDFFHRPLLSAVMARVDLFSAPLKEDFELLRNALGPRFRARYAQLNYGSVERTFSTGTEGLTGNDILLGNSATPTNNHIDMLRLLAKCELGNKKVVVPLSYGDPAYRDAIVTLGKQLLGARFDPLLAFMPLADYNAQIGRCAIAIMNHRRQQALGNIGAALYRGAKVFLDETGMMFRFFKDRGAYVFSTRQLDKIGATDFEPLAADQQAQNRAVLEALWSQETVLRNAKAFVGAAAACRSSSVR